MTMHAAISGWLLGPHSGANRRLLAILEHLPALLTTGERITVLHRVDYVPPRLPRIEWTPIAIPAGPTWRRVRAESRERFKLVISNLATAGCEGVVLGYTEAGLLLSDETPALPLYDSTALLARAAVKMALGM